MAKFGIKKIVLALAGLGLTGAAFASLTPDSAFSNPTPTGYGWHISAMGDWLQPNTSNLEFASVNTTSSTTNGSITTNSGNGSFGEGIEPKYDFGYGFEIGMQIPGTTDDVTVNWQQLDANDSANFNLPNQVSHSTTPSTHSSNTTIVLPDLNDVTNAHSKVDVDYDAVNLEFGHTIFDNQWTVRPFAGLQYARLDVDQDTNGSAHYSSTNTATPPVTTTTNVIDFVDEDSGFHGIGPRAGVDAKYNLGYGFGVVGEAAGELLVGTLTSSLNSTNVASVSATNNSSGSLTSVQSVNPEEEHIVVPGLEAKAGLAYDQVINPSLCLGIEAGYYVGDYIDATARSNGAGEVSSSGSSSDDITGHGNGNNGTNIAANNHNTSSFFASNRDASYSMSGPYVALSLNF